MSILSEIIRRGKVALNSNFENMGDAKLFLILVVWTVIFQAAALFYWTLANMRSNSPFVNVITVGLP